LNQKFNNINYSLLTFDQATVETCFFYILLMNLKFQQCKKDYSKTVALAGETAKFRMPNSNASSTLCSCSLRILLWVVTIWHMTDAFSGNLYPGRIYLWWMTVHGSLFF